MSYTAIARSTSGARREYAKELWVHSQMKKGAILKALKEKFGASMGGVTFDEVVKGLSRNGKKNGVNAFEIKEAIKTSVQDNPLSVLANQVADLARKLGYDCVTIKWIADKKYLEIQKREKSVYELD